MPRRTTIFFLAFSLFAIALIGFFAYRAYFTPEAISRREVEKWVGIVGERVELPRGETPTVATVTNPEKLRNQAFLKDAERGDKILVYPRAGRAVLFRPSTGRVLGMTDDIVIERE